MNSFIITEAGASIGFGHLTRCLALAEILKEKKIDPVFIINEDNKSEDLIKKYNYKMFDWLNENKKLFRIINNADIVFIDSYLADLDFYRQVADKVKLGVYIDDNMRLDYPKGIVLNPNIYAKNLKYADKEGLLYLMGLEYVLLRKSFWNIKNKVIKENIKSILVTVGGSDSRNLTPKILGVLVNKYPDIKKNVIIGKGFNAIKEIENIKDNNTELLLNIDAEKMKEIMLKSDIAISGAGQTLNELALCGIPTVAIKIADNQDNNVYEWNRIGFIDYVGSYNETDLLHNIDIAISNLKDKSIRQKKSEIGLNSVSKNNFKNVLGKILSLYYSKELNLSLVSKEDEKNIYNLSNDPEVRKNSFNGKNIDLEEHKEWFHKQLVNENCLFLIGNVGKEFAAQIRFDLKDNVATINLSIVKKFRGQGIGKILLKKAIDLFNKKTGEVQIIAFVKKENIVSCNLFINNGFKLLGKTKIESCMSYKFIYEGNKNGL